MVILSYICRELDDRLQRRLQCKGDFKVVISSFYLHSMVGFILTPLMADLMAWLSINIIKFALSFSYLRSIRYLR